MSDVSLLDKLRYYFDAKKGATESYVKNVFKQMMYKNSELTPSGTLVFEAIWSNVALRSDLFKVDIQDFSLDNNLIKPIGLAKFKEKISSANNEFYNFIKVK